MSTKEGYGKVSDLIDKIEEWAKERDLDTADSSKQLLRLQEELDELTQGHIKKNHDHVVDSVGDLLVVLIIYCQQMGLSLPICLMKAYYGIKEHKGEATNAYIGKKGGSIDELIRHYFN